ncbi:MAG: response regulator transcription factor [Gammaproteobacteria bacterium]|nr:response regulator transcription factor [Gammaproteobacteria bacterium]
MRLLLVEDDAALSRRLKSDLTAAGYAVDVADNGIDGEFMGDEEPYDGIILDLGLPGRPGLEVLRNWRSRGSAVPVVVLTARDAWHERVDGLKAGADDYLGKPFHVEELLARLSAVLRRRHGRADEQISCAGLMLDEDRQTVTTAAGESFDLTGTEFRLLRYFMLHPGQVLSKTRLTEHVYEGDADRDSNVIEVYVNRLRQKFGKSLIETRRGQGYIFGDNHR